MIARRSILVVMAVAVARAPGVGEERRAVDGVIKLGMSTALSGPTADLGRNMRAGVLAALAEVNHAGGIRGKQLHLEVRDDGYEPTRTVPNMRRLIEGEQVLAVIGNVGTPTAVAAIPIAVSGGVPFFGAYTGAGVLRQTPPQREVINYRASYAEEVGAMVAALIRHGGLKPEEIGFFTQRDAYGDACFAGGVAALERFGVKDERAIPHGEYERNTVAVENGLADILLAESPVRAVIMAGTYRPCAVFIRMAQEYGLDAIFLNVSFVGSESLATTLGADGDGVIVTQVVPHYDANLPIVREYRRAIEPAEPTFGSLEGYIAGRILCRALESLDAAPTRENTIEALEGLGPFEMGLGEPLRLGPDEHQACHTVWPTVLRGGEVLPYRWEELGVRSDTGAR